MKGILAYLRNTLFDNKRKQEEQKEIERFTLEFRKWCEEEIAKGVTNRAKS